MTGALYGLARFCARHRFWILTVWLVVAVALVGVSHRLGDNTNDNLTLPGTGSQHATDALSKSFPDQANGTSPIVLHVSNGKLTDSKYASAVNQAAADVAKEPYVASVVNPLTSQGASALSTSKATGYLSVTTTVSAGQLSVGDAHTIIDAATKPARSTPTTTTTPKTWDARIQPIATKVEELRGRRAPGQGLAARDIAHGRGLEIDLGGVALLERIRDARAFQRREGEIDAVAVAV